MTAKIEKNAITMKKLSLSGSKVPFEYCFKGNFSVVPLGNLILLALSKENLYLNCCNFTTKNPILWLLECFSFPLRGFVNLCYKSRESTSRHFFCLVQFLFVRTVCKFKQIMFKYSEKMCTG